MSATTTTTTTTTTATPSVPRDVHAATTLIADEGVVSSTLRYGALLTPHEPDHSDRQTMTSNPEWWPTQHRRIPDYRQARCHPQWNTLTDSTREAFMINMMFRGCYLLNIIDWIPRVFGYDTSYFTYRIAGEW